MTQEYGSRSGSSRDYGSSYGSRGYGGGSGQDYYGSSSRRDYGSRGGSSYGRGGGGGGYGGRSDYDDFGGSTETPDWKTIKLQPFKKDFYVEHEAVKNRSDAEVEAYRQKHELTLQGKDIPKPVFTFEEANMPSKLLRGLLDLKFEAPTVIQAQGWPMALS
ncbi:putative ATP-dependent RNA helicase ddx17, partial [Dimargaris xerosporica]